MAMPTRFNTIKKGESLSLESKSHKFKAFSIEPNLLSSLPDLLSAMKASSILLWRKLAALAKRRIFINLTPKKPKTSTGLTTPKNKKSYFLASTLKPVTFFSFFFGFFFFFPKAFLGGFFFRPKKLWWWKKYFSLESFVKTCKSSRKPHYCSKKTKLH